MFNSTKQHLKKMQTLVYKAWKTAEKLLRDGYDKWKEKFEWKTFYTKQNIKPVNTKTILAQKSE